jgi:hypothetical protein
MRRRRLGYRRRHMERVPCRGSCPSSMRLWWLWVLWVHLASAHASMFWGELRLLSSSEGKPCACTNRSETINGWGRACEAAEEIATAAICQQSRRFVLAGFSLVFATLGSGPVGFDGVGFVPISFDAFDAVIAVNRDAHRCSRRL